jgi:ribosome-associated protein
MIEAAPGIWILDDEIALRAARASGPGGQHVNKTSTAIELRFDVANSPTLPDEVKARLIKLGGSRVSQEGVLILFAQGERSQEMNRQDARARLLALIRRAAEKPKKRVATKPTYGSKVRRLTSKKIRSDVKSARARPVDDE